MALPISVDVAQWLIIPAAFALDAVVGDPRVLPHPVRWMGRAIEICELIFRKYVSNQYLSGMLFALCLIFGCWWVTTLVSNAAHRLNAIAGFTLDTVMIFYCLSARSLFQAGMEIHRLLKNGSVHIARSKLAMIVGRDVEHYGPDDIACATVETVSENFVDGVLSPLIYAAIGGAPLAMAYKMVNTLDSMVGYKNDRYRHFGWAAARIDDFINFIPARISIAIISLAAGMLAPRKGRRALAIAVQEGARHSSPNAGYPEAAFAGVLAVKLNGPNYYGGVVVNKPYIGTAFGSAGLRHIQRACELMMFSAMVAVVAAWAVSVVF